MYNSKSLAKIPFFFILSMGRSGSTLLEFLLDAHPNINIPLESTFIIHLYYKYGKKTSWTKKEKNAFIHDLYTDDKLANFWEIDRNQLERDVLNTKPNVTFFELCQIITANYVSFYPKEEIKVQGSKNPVYGLWSEELHQLNKESKFIHLVRNPMGVTASQKKLGHKHTVYYAYRWNLVQKKIETLKQKNPANFITVNYESLINQPEDELKRICTFLGITFLPKQLQFNEKIKIFHKQITASNENEKIKMFNSHLKNLVHPIKKSIGDSWNNILSEQEKEDIAHITNDVASQYGYYCNHGKFKMVFIFAQLKLKFRYLRHKLYYRFSLSIK